MKNDNETKTCAKPMERALALLSPIPKEDFLIGDFTNGEGKCCAMGHLIRLTSGDPTNYDPTNCSDIGYDALDNADKTFRRASEEALQSMGVNGYVSTQTSLADVNNGRVQEYPQPEIKDRVMAFLEDAVEVCNGREPKNLKLSTDE